MLVNRLADFIRYDYDWYRTRGIIDTCNEDGSRSGASSFESRLAVIGTLAFSGTPAFEIEESVQAASLSLSFPFLKSQKMTCQESFLGDWEKFIPFSLVLFELSRIAI